MAQLGNGYTLNEIILKNNYVKGPAGAILATSASESHFLIPPLHSTHSGPYQITVVKSKKAWGS
jgi:hypothetical protein